VPYLGLILAIGFLLTDLRSRAPILVVIICVFLLIFNSFAAWSRDDLWGKPFKAALSWSNQQPGSEAAADLAAQHLHSRGFSEEAIKVLSRAYLQHKSPFVLLGMINLACSANLNVELDRLTKFEFSSIGYRPEASYLLMNTVRDGHYISCAHLREQEFRKVIDQLISNRLYARGGQHKVMYTIRGILNLREGRVGFAVLDFRKSRSLGGEDLLAVQAEYVRALGHCEEVKLLKEQDDLAKFLALPKNGC
jgi:hypothetical protein